MSASQTRRQIVPNGVVLDDRFEIVELLGAGCFGAVYRARQLVFGQILREIALKLFEGTAVTRSNVHEVLNDGIRLASLQESDPKPDISRHIIQVYDVGMLHVPEPRAFMSMKLVPGRKTLDHIVRRFRDGLMPVETSLRYLRQLLIPLAWMHTLDEPVVHGDLKPDNVLLSMNDDLIVADFGLAARLPLGTLGGAIAYQAPETLLGQSGLTASDMYGVGLIWYELLTGRHPFDGVGLEAQAADDSGAYLAAHQQARKWPMRPAEPGEELSQAPRIPLASELNEDLREHPQVEALLRRCFAYFPTQRFTHARVLLEAIDRYIGSGSTGDVGAAPAEQPPTLEDVARPKTPAMLVDDSRSLHAQGRHVEALAKTEEALRQDPKHVPAWLARARALAAARQFASAREACGRAQAVAPDDPDVLETLADVYEADQKAGLADNLRKQAVALRARRRRIVRGSA